MHHIDVVPAAAAEWTRPAFAGMRSNGYIWGRGALDVKSLGIAQLVAMVELKRRGVPLQRDIIFLAVADEELGGVHGCKELLETRSELFDNVGYVINEGGYNETIVDKVTFWGIETQQKIPLWLRLHVKGVGGHAASPPDGGGTLAKLVRALAAVEKIETPYRLTPSVTTYFHAYGAVRPDERGAMLRTIAEPLDAARVERVLPPGYRSLLHDTIAITRIEGGSAVNSIPALATADIDIRLLPDAHPGAMLDRVRAAVAGGGELETLLSGVPIEETSTDTDLFRVMTKAMQDYEPGSVVAAVVNGGTSDSRYFRQRGIPAYGVAPFKVNYYDAGTVHGSDERIRERFFVEGTHLMRRIVRDFCQAAGQPK
jgi:acetylornithine deacetylase/succinyl-diaminopimelate desuccinylase-like protein